jgi:NAD(P)-dependent dehydrogenase (short-subunit alcohol dehydrogenase family)
VGTLRVLLTGAGGGIGLALCDALGVLGAEVWLLGRNPSRLEEAQARVAAAGGEGRLLTADLGDPASVEGAAAELLRAGSLDWVLQNAGIVETASVRAAAADDAHARRMMEVNFHAPRQLTQRLLPLLEASPQGQALFVASSAALGGAPYVAGYAASKHALLGWARCAALDLRGRVGVQVVCPHFVDSPMTDAGARFVSERTGKDLESVKGEYAGLNPSGVLVTPAEVAGAALELLQGSRTGQVLELRGGGQRAFVEAGLPAGPRT